MKRFQLGDVLIFEGQPDNGNPYTAGNRLEGDSRVAAVRQFRGGVNTHGYVLWSDSAKRYLQPDEVNWQ
jgi:hypothetical protein